MSKEGKIIIERLDQLARGQARLVRGQQALSAGQSRVERTLASGGEHCWPWDTLIRRRQVRKAYQVHYAIGVWVREGCTLKAACEKAVKDRPSGYKTAQQLYAYCNKPWRRNKFNAYRDLNSMK